jgi:hypothetical protein
MPSFALRFVPRGAYARLRWRRHLPRIRLIRMPRRAAGASGARNAVAALGAQSDLEHAAEGATRSRMPTRPRPPVHPRAGARVVGNRGRARERSHRSPGLQLAVAPTASAAGRWTR